MALTEEQINCAVEWWKNVLRKPKFDTLGHDSGRPINAGEPAALAEMMAAGAHKRPEDGILDRFAANLRERLQAVGDGWFTLGTDYHPEPMLWDSYVDALPDDQKERASGMLTFPWKTIMWFQDGGVQVSYGYGAPREELLLAEEDQ